MVLSDYFKLLPSSPPTRHAVAYAGVQVIPVSLGSAPGRCSGGQEGKSGAKDRAACCWSAHGPLARTAVQVDAVPLLLRQHRSGEVRSVDGRDRALRRPVVLLVPMVLRSRDARSWRESDGSGWDPVVSRPPKADEARDPSATLRSRAPLWRSSARWGRETLRSSWRVSLSIEQVPDDLLPERAPTIMSTFLGAADSLSLPKPPQPTLESFLADRHDSP